MNYDRIITYICGCKNYVTWVCASDHLYDELRQTFSNSKVAIGSSALEIDSH